MKILVTGSVALDSIKTPYGEVEETLGGSASYFSVAASFFAPVHMVAAVGSDFPRENLEMLEKCRVDTSGVVVEEGKTFRWKGEYPANMNERKSLLTDLGVFSAFEPKIPPAGQTCPVLYLGNIDPVLQDHVLRQVPARRLVGLDTMNYWIQGKRDDLLKILPEVDIFFLNDGEALELAGVQRIVRAGKEILTMGPRIVVIKRGEAGVLVMGTAATFVLPAFPTDAVVDPTGAGDTFAGGFMGYLAEAGAQPDEEALKSAAFYGTVLASFCVEDLGLRRLLAVDRSEVAERAGAFGRMLEIPSFLFPR
jgi:sugar/nucleoside kinase (ribokinase family)